MKINRTTSLTPVESIEAIRERKRRQQQYAKKSKSKRPPFDPGPGIA